ncbi:restriction endonuclease subunit S, partial [Nostoc sp.]|uniref:restriction endonuclease subunit S n=1 Tax=Nostoc sp. TaxID=1180 RepID=UPI002FFA47D0
SNMLPSLNNLFFYIFQVYNLCGWFDIKLLLIVVRGMILAQHFPVTITKRTVAFNQDLKALECSPEVEPQFLFHWLRGKSYEILGLADEAAHGTKRLQTDRLKNLPLHLPPLPTQKKIAAILSGYDDLIENNTRRIKILEEMAQTLYDEWFVKFRFPGCEQVQMVESELGAIPERWEIKQLSDVCVRITDGSHWSPKSTDDGYPMASVKDMHTWGFNLKTCRKISQQDYQKLVKNDCKPLKNDVLIAKDGSYLKHIFVTEEEQEMVILSSIALLRPADNILPYILSSYLLQPSIKTRMSGYVSGVAIPRIILKDFRNFSILVPPIVLQKKYYELTESMITNCHQLIKKNHNLRQTRDLLLPKLISGEIDVERLDITTEEIAA